MSLQSANVDAVSCQICITIQLLHNGNRVRDPFSGIIAVAMRVARPPPEAASAGLRTGDKLPAVNGQPFKGVGDYYEALQNAKSGYRLRLQGSAGL